MNPIGHSSPAFCHEPVAATAEAVADAGFDVWEVVGEGLHDAWENRQEFRRVLPSYDFKVQLHAPISDCNLGSLASRAWDFSVETVERSLRGAREIGAQRVTIHPGNHTPLSREHYPLLHEATRKALRRIDHMGRDLGLQLCLENMATGWAFETDSIEKLRDLVQGTSFAFTFDLGHAHVAKRLAEFDAAAREMGNVHVHDNKGDVDAHLTLGEGTLPWDRTVRALLRGGYTGTFVIESRSHDSGRASLVALRAALQRVVA